MKKIIISVLLLTLPLISIAETCPHILHVKQNKLLDWKAFDSDDSTPLSAQQFAQFRQQIETFALAEWKSGKNKLGEIRCYYRDKSGSALEAYISKPNYAPDNSYNRWYAVSGSLHCAADKEQCGFKAKLPTLAEKTQATPKLD